MFKERPPLALKMITTFLVVMFSFGVTRSTWAEDSAKIPTTVVDYNAIAAIVSATIQASGNGGVFDGSNVSVEGPAGGPVLATLLSENSTEVLTWNKFLGCFGAEGKRQQSSTRIFAAGGSDIKVLIQRSCGLNDPEARIILKITNAIAKTLRVRVGEEAPVLAEQVVKNAAAIYQLNLDVDGLAKGIVYLKGEIAIYQILTRAFVLQQQPNGSWNAIMSIPITSKGYGVTSVTDGVDKKNVSTQYVIFNHSAFKTDTIRKVGRTINLSGNLVTGNVDFYQFSTWIGEVKFGKCIDPAESANAYCRANSK